MKNILCVWVIFFAIFTSAFAHELTHEDVKKIILSATNISQKQASILVSQIEKTHGLSETGNLNISSLLIGSRVNYGFFKDRKIWNFAASFIPNGSKQVVTVPDLVEAEFFNGGLKLNLISKDFVIITLPKGMTVERLHNLETDRGGALSFVGITLSMVGAVSPSLALASRLVLPLGFIDVAPGFSNSKFGSLGIFTGGFGLKLNFLTFPKFKFKINEKYLSSPAW